MFRFLTAALVAVFFMPGPVVAHDHYGWVMDNEKTSYCCGPEDCRSLGAGELTSRDGAWRINGHTVPAENVHLSAAPDALHHACFAGLEYELPRCQFIPGMM